MNIQSNSIRRVLALVLVLAMMTALLCGCAGTDEAGDKLPEGVPAGLSEANRGDVLELPSFNVISGNDDPFAYIPDESDDPETSGEQLDLDKMLEDPDPSEYELDLGKQSGSSEPLPTEYFPTLPRELMGRSMVITFTILNTECYPVKDAKVELGKYSGKTNANGEVKLKIESGIYELYVSAEGYVSYSEDIAISQNDTEISIQIADANSVRKILSNAELHPYVTNYPELEAELDKLFDVLFEDGMDTYDKVLACYDYIIDHMEYKSPKHWVSAKAFWPCAHQSLLEGIGTCNCYSALFTVMMRHIGLDCSIVTGYTSSVSGGFTSHDWTTICIKGNYYIFDCQVEDAIADRTASKEVKYVRFCLAEPHAKYVYRNKSRASCIKDFEKYLLANGHFVDE